MRTHEILKLGISISISFYSASSVDVSIGRRRNRRAIHHSRGLSESTTESNRGYNHATPRSLGVGLENLKYGKSVKQHYVVEERGGGKGKGGYSADSSKGKGKGYTQHYVVEKRGEGKGKGGYSTDSSKGKGKGYTPSRERGKGKGHYDSDSIDISPSPSPTKSTKSSKPKYEKKKHVKSKREKHAKLRKSDKSSPTFQPVFYPTSLPESQDSTDTPEVPSAGSSDDALMGSLTPYTILYTTSDDDRVPFRSELLEVVELTRQYLDRFFLSYYDKSELTDLSEVLTLFTNTRFDYGEPIPIDYESKVVFEGDSIVFPDTQDLDNTLASAFEGENLDVYIGLLQSLPPSNMFSSTQFTKLIQGEVESQTIMTDSLSQRSIARNITLSAIVVGGVAGLFLIFASTRFVRRKTNHKNDGGSFGHKSIAGETFNTRDSRTDDRMFRPICEELYSDTIESRR